MKIFGKIKRIMLHWWWPSWRVKDYFPQRSLDRLQAGIAASEHSHLGQICFVVESGWNAAVIWQGKTPHERALEWFGLTRAWDTERNSSVLIYVSFADHALEIIADRGVAHCVDDAVWAEICAQMRPFFADRCPIVGLQVGLDAATKVLRQHFPREGESVHNELADEVIVR